MSGQQALSEISTASSDQGERSCSFPEQCRGSKYSPSAYTKTVRIPCRHFPSIFGVGFAYLKTLEKHYSVSIRVHEEILSGKSGFTFHKCYIRGVRDNVEQAATAISGKVRKRIDYDNVFEEKVSVPHEFAGEVIGKGGANLRRMREATGAIISVLDDTRDTECILTVRGPKEAVEKCKNLVQALMKQGQLCVRVPTDKMGLLIGKGGQVLHSLSEEFGVKLRIGEAKVAAGAYKEVTMVGSEMALQSCDQRIRQLVGSGGKALRSVSQPASIESSRMVTDVSDSWAVSIIETARWDKCCRRRKKEH